jgi:hypothetical protein
MTHELRCEWTDFYPIESCPTRILNMYTNERMQSAVNTRSMEADTYHESDRQKVQRKIYNQRRKKSLTTNW